MDSASSEPTSVRLVIREQVSAIAAWFRKRDWQILPHQSQTWAAIEAGESGLVLLPTGMGKTYAAFLGFLPLLNADTDHLLLLYVTPLKALTRDIEKSLTVAVGDLAPDLRLETRTGDSRSSMRQRQKKRMPHILVTTPESLALLLSYEDSSSRFAQLCGIIVDEWHDLIGTKRGSLLELNLAQLRRLRPELRIWGLSATLANPEQAARTLCGPQCSPRIIRSTVQRKLRFETLLPAPGSSLPWAGHLGLLLAPELARQLSPKHPTLIFTNTRSQAERWYDALSLLMPEWEGTLALHHGSLAPKAREQIEAGLKSGSISIVVCTASLDLGVDFTGIQRVVQIGSPKQLARLLQRAGRAAHQPGAAGELWFVPTHALELVEALAFRQALAQARVEARLPLHQPMDVLIQYIVSRALAGGVAMADLQQELADTESYQSLSIDDLNWALRFVTDGGGTLSAYPQYCKIQNNDGIYRVKDRMIGIRHRQNIGTITADASLAVKLSRGRSLGTIEESFIAKLRPGETFLFAGHWLELVALRDMTAYVKASKRNKNGTIPVWNGGSLPWSAELSESMRSVLGQYAASGRLADSPEKPHLEPILATQAKLSRVPAYDELLIESASSRDGQHIFIYPFAGRALHEGLGAILALRLSRLHPGTYAVAANDYGCELLLGHDFPDLPCDWRELLRATALDKDLEEALHLGELAKRQFRGIARVAGLVLQNIPGSNKAARQLQTSSSILYDVFAQFDADNKLLQQAKAEALSSLLDGGKLLELCLELQSRHIRTVKTKLFSPFAFPLYLERTSARLSNEDMGQRIAKMQAQWLAIGRG